VVVVVVVVVNVVLLAVLSPVTAPVAAVGRARAVTVVVGVGGVARDAVLQVPHGSQRVPAPLARHCGRCCGTGPGGGRRARGALEHDPFLRCPQLLVAPHALREAAGGLVHVAVTCA